MRLRIFQENSLNVWECWTLTLRIHSKKCVCRPKEKGREGKDDAERKDFASWLM